jgi:hypothetical protein
MDYGAIHNFQHIHECTNREGLLRLYTFQNLKIFFFIHYPIKSLSDAVRGKCTHEKVDNCDRCYRSHYIVQMSVI